MVCTADKLLCIIQNIFTDPSRKLNNDATSRHAIRMLPLVAANMMYEIW
jgi:hypothetical protein